MPGTRSFAAPGAWPAAAPWRAAPAAAVRRTAASRRAARRGALLLAALSGLGLAVALAQGATVAAPAPATAEIAVGDVPPLVAPAVAGRGTAEGAPPTTRPPAHDMVAIRDSVELRSEPGGPVVTTLGPTTEFGSATALSVAEEKGRWLGVRSAALPNGELGWIDSRGGAIELDKTRFSVEADLSRRRVEVLRDDRVVDRFTVAIGRPGSSTPTGRFAITDELDGAAYGPYVGCCVLALSGRQPDLPPGWTGGDRLAIHGTNAPQTIGQPASAGCLRGADTDLRRLMDRVPVGTPVTIRA